MSKSKKCTKKKDKKITIVREYLYDLNTKFKFDEKMMEILNIPQIPKIDGRDEEWVYVYLDKYDDGDYNFLRNYMISSYGRVYSWKRNTILTQYQSDFFKTSKGQYRLVSLMIGKKSRKYFVHRLVALAFLLEDPERQFVNHIDGIPYHNYAWNLEWTTTSENYIHALKTGLKVDAKGEDRSNAKWTNEEVHMICKMMEDGHKATYIYKSLVEILKDEKVQYERVRSLYKHIKHGTHWTEISSQYNIPSKKFDYSKETSSVKMQSDN